MGNDYQEMIDKVSGAYKIVPQDYPVVEKLTQDETFTFSISHTGKHITKALGKIMSQLEEADHGGIADKVAIRKATYSLFISCFKLADEQGITGKELKEELPKHI